MTNWRERWFGAKKRTIKTVALLLIVITMVGLFIPLPDPLFHKSYATVLESREGKLLAAKIATDEQWRFPEIDSVPDKFKTCLLAFEDNYFYYHPGVNPISLVRAFKLNIDAGHVVSGGSTLTMQLARLLRENPKRTIANKLIELWLAFKLELQYSKDELLAFYASHAPFGGNTVGLSAASWRYFQRHPHQLSWAESATLAVLPNAPGLVYPGAFDKVLKAKRDRLLKLLYRQGTLSETDYTLAVAERTPPRPKVMPELATHLLQRVSIEKDQKKAGIHFKSSISYSLQKQMNRLVHDYHLQWAFREVHNAAVLVLDINTGETLAYVGNVKGESNGIHGEQVDIINRKRSPGSLLKPILYGLAMDEGLLAPQQLLPDIPMHYQGFAPKNFDKQFRGAVPANEALRQSLNVPFVGLLRDYGYEKFHLKLQQMGLTGFNKPSGHYGLTMILGGAEASLWELTSLYASMGRVLKRFKNTSGVEKYNRADYHANRYTVSDTTNPKTLSLQHKGLIDAGSIWTMFKEMKELNRPNEAINWKQFSSSKQIAWKTGTSYGHKDAWAIGLNGTHVVGVWLGNADGEGRPDLVGSTAAAPLMFSVFDALPLGDPTFFDAPSECVRDLVICTESGMKAGEYCPITKIQLVNDKVKKTKACNYHTILHLDSTQSWQVNSSCYDVSNMVNHPWFILPPTQAWYYAKNHHTYKAPPEFKENCITELPAMEIVYPKHRARIYIPIEIDGQKGRTIFEASHSNPEAIIYWYLDNEFVGQTQGVHQMEVYPTKGSHTMSIIDEQGISLTRSFEVLNEYKGE